MPKSTTSIYLDDEYIAQLTKFAVEDNRSRANYIELVLIDHIRTKLAEQKRNK